jgi:hypothetical protein
MEFFTYGSGVLTALILWITIAMIVIFKNKRDSEVMKAIIFPIIFNSLLSWVGVALTILGVSLLLSIILKEENECN